ncbi:MAG: HAD family hydrolase [Clostridia bacterium]|nr:HAD family hydrolase [Clostridia bacterium]
MKKYYTHVIWDFNGTVLNDMQAGIDSINVMLAARGLPVLSDLSAYRAVFDFPVEDYYRRLGFDFEKEDFKTVLAPLWVSLYEKNSIRAPLFPGVEPLTRALRRIGVKQSILSASHSDMLKQQLAARGALDWFDEIWGTDSIHAYGKAGLAAAWREAHPGEAAVLLGDTVHDDAVAREIGADCILIAAGYHSREKLEGCGAPVVDDLFACAELLLNIIK